MKVFQGESSLDSLICGGADLNVLKQIVRERRCALVKMPD